MALEQEIAALQADVTNTQQLAKQMTSLAAALAQALVLAGQFATTVSNASQQVTTLAAGVHDLPSALQAVLATRQVQQQIQGALPTLGPAEQAWSTARTLSQQRSGWLLAHWQQCHTESPAGTPIAMAEPLTQALAGYVATVTQLDVTMQEAPLFPPQPLPTATPAQVIAWLQGLSTQLAGSAALINADRGQLNTSLSWVNVQSTAANAITSAQGQVTLAQRIATALAGTIDPASLAARLADLTALRVSICPDPITPADRAIYNQRMAELGQALAGLLGASTGAAASSPAVLLGVRLEVRTFPAAAGGTEFRIRVYPDRIHVNAHDPRLTPDEAQWAAHVTAVTAGGAQLPAAEWAQLAARFGPARAAYLLNPDSSAGSRPGPWTKPPTTAALPDHWMAVAYGPDGTMIGAAEGAPITPLPLQVGPDPLAAMAASDNGMQADPGVRWMIDFDIAVTQGMGISLVVDGGAAGMPGPGSATATGPATLSRLVVVGVRAADATSTLTGLLAAHHFTSGLGLVSQGTQTNNTSDAPSGFSRSDPGYARSYALEVLRPAAAGDATRLAAALGLSPGLFATAAAAPLAEQLDQQAMTALTWPATWGTFLTGFTGMSQARAERLRSWAVAWLRPAGPLPALSIGPRPYGIVPVVALDAWADAGDAAAADVHGALTGLIGTWLAADPAVAGLDFDSLLARRPVTATARGRVAGIMPGWLQNGYDLMSVANSQIMTDINVTLPAQLAQIGSSCGLPGPLTWPGGLLALPDPDAAAAPWPLVVPDGTLPFTAAPGQQPGGYLAGLLTSGPAAHPGSLLEFVAGQSWTLTAGVSASTRTISPRGMLGEAPEPAPPTAADELHGAVGYLAGRAGADFDLLFGGALDAASHRLDGWATALATRRLGELRTASQTGILVGGYGWVESLVARPPLAPAQIPAEPAALADPYNAGYQLAPSLQQATTAAVLRSGHLTHNPLTPGSPPLAGAAAFAVDLSSRRARLATWLLDGVRQGQPLSVLLGYRFERSLADAGLGDLIEVFRTVAPYAPVTTTGGGGATPTEAAVPTDVVDGVVLSRVAPSQPGPATADQWTKAQPALAELTDALDAAADAVTAQALHNSLTGNTFAAAATLDSVTSGAVPAPELSFLSTPRTGIAVNHRILVPVPAGRPSPPGGWPATPRGNAEPALTQWAAGLLGDPAKVTAAVTLVDQAGAPLPGGPVAITLSSLGLGPLDVIALAGRPAELDRLAVHSVLSARASTDPPASDGTLDPSPAGAARPLSAVLSVARSAGHLIGAGRGADARDLAPAGTVTDPGASLSDLAARVDGSTSGPPGVIAELNSAGTALANALPGDPLPGTGPPARIGIPPGADPNALAAALVQAVLLGVTGAAPAGTGAAALPALVSQARGARAEIVRRQSAVQALEPPPSTAPPPPAPAAVLAARLGQLAAAFGGGFVALPVVTPDPANLLSQAAALTVTATADPGQGPEAWLVKAGRVHQPVADLLDTCCAAEALGTGPRLALSIAQLPLPAATAAGAAPAPAPWAALPFTGEPPPANCLSLTMAASAVPSGALSALLVADWVEVIPSATEIAGLTYHYGAPDAQAPQAVLLAVPARLGSAAWTHGDLVGTVATARNLAHARGVDYADLPAAARQVLPAAYFANPTALQPGPWSAALSQLAVPAGFMVQTQPASISSVSVRGGALEQAKTGQITVNGANFAPTGAQGTPVPLPPAAFTVTGGGVTVIAAGSTVTNTQAVLNVTVDQNATPGVRGVSVGLAVLANCVTINPQPRATGCDTTMLSQGMVRVTRTITVTGQALSRASVSLTGSALVTTVASASSTQVLISVTIAASTYSPYQPPQTSPTLARLPAPNGGGTGGDGYRPPEHIYVPLTLSITPGPGEPVANFAIVLDEIR